MGDITWIVTSFFRGPRLLAVQRLKRWTALAVLCPVSVLAQSAPAIGELFAAGNGRQTPTLLSGSGIAVSSGSNVSAGKSAATLRLVRGGEVRVCPQSSVMINALPDNEAFVLGMGNGDVEINYPINDFADTLITPDFKILLAGPGTFHFALGVSAHGDTCIRPLRGNTSSVIVSETQSQATYQVKADESVLFPGGKLDGHSPFVAECGCPSPLPSLLAERRESEGGEAATSKQPVQLQAEAPLVFRGDQQVQQPYTIAKVKFSSLPNELLPQEKVEPVVLGTKSPESTNKKESFFSRIKGFFSSIFHR